MHKTSMMHATVKHLGVVTETLAKANTRRERNTLRKAIKKAQVAVDVAVSSLYLEGKGDFDVLSCSEGESSDGSQVGASNQGNDGMMYLSGVLGDSVTRSSTRKGASHAHPGYSVELNRRETVLRKRLLKSRFPISLHERVKPIRCSIDIK